MDKILTSKDILGFVFNRLRNQEGISKGRVTGCMDDETVFKVLINARYKQEKGLMLTELESLVRKESGNFIMMYVGQKWEEAKRQLSFPSLPYNELEGLTVGSFVNKNGYSRSVS